jgi:hypothetical protein
MTIKRNNTQLLLLSQLSSKSATLKRTFNNSENHATQAPQACHNKLKPFHFRHRIGLSVRGAITWKCDNCNYPWVIPTSTGELTIWKCCHCEAPRLAQRQKTDSVLISELLDHPRLSSFEKTFVLTHSAKVGTWQRKRIQGFARRLEISLEFNCSLLMVWRLSHESHPHQQK